MADPDLPDIEIVKRHGGARGTNQIAPSEIGLAETAAHLLLSAGGSDPCEFLRLKSFARLAETQDHGSQGKCHD